jgi:hypothetical protein
MKPEGSIAIKKINIDDYNLYADESDNFQIDNLNNVDRFGNAEKFNLFALERITYVMNEGANPNITIRGFSSYYLHNVLEVRLFIDITVSFNFAADNIMFDLPFESSDFQIGPVWISDPYDESFATNLGSIYVSNSRDTAFVKSNLFNPSYVGDLRIQAALNYKKV